MSVPSLDNDPEYQQFTKDLESLRGRVGLHRADDQWVSRVLSQLPSHRKVSVPRDERFFQWAVPFVVGGAAASVAILFFSPFSLMDGVRKTPGQTASMSTSPAPSNAPAAVAAKKVAPETTAVRLTHLMSDYQAVNRWLADAGVTSPANKAYGMDVLTDLAATGFTDSDWKLYRAALPAPRSVTELLQGAQCAHLWQRAGVAPEAWQPILAKAAERKRLADVLLVSQTVRTERIDPQILMTALENGLTGDKNPQNILSEMRTAALPQNSLPQDSPQVRVETIPPAAALPAE